MKKIILFDIDETLATCPGNNEASAVMFKKVFKVDACEDLIPIKIRAGKTQKCIIEEILRLFKNIDPNQEIKIPDAAFEVWGEAQSEILKKNPPVVLPGIKELLMTLAKDPDILLCILTGNCRYRTAAKLKAAGLKDFFTDNNGLVRGAFGDISNKRTDLILVAQRKLGEGTYIIIDDSIKGGKMIKENNIPAILVATGSASVEQLREYSKYVFENFGHNRWQEAIKIIQHL